MEIYKAFTLIIVLASIFGYINHRFLNFPNSIGVMLLGLVSSLVIICIGYFNPTFFNHSQIFVQKIDLQVALMDIMLSFLLFAGSIHLKIDELKSEKASIFTFSTIGVFISTFLFATTMYFLFSLFKLNVPYVYCLLFGSIVSPTDPIAVIGILRDAKVPKSLEVKITGESLFNDGVAVVVFVTIYKAIEGGVESITLAKVLRYFLQEAVGGIVFGFILGQVVYYLLKTIDNYKIEVLITLALVMGGYLLAKQLHISGPLAMVVAGLIVGNKGRDSMSDETRDYIDKFWEMIDEVLNAILFILIGLKLLEINFTPQYLWLGIIGIAVLLAARYLSLFVPIKTLLFKKTFERKALPILTWGGLRGGISVALALSLPEEMYGEVFSSITYIIVAFSILVQGLTIGRLARKQTAEH